MKKGKTLQKLAVPFFHYLKLFEMNVYTINLKKNDFYPQQTLTS